MLVGNTTWHAGVGMFCVLKHLIKSKNQKPEEIFLFALSSILFTSIFV